VVYKSKTIFAYTQTYTYKLKFSSFMQEYFPHSSSSPLTQADSASYLLSLSKFFLLFFFLSINGKPSVSFPVQTTGMSVSK